MTWRREAALLAALALVVLLGGAWAYRAPLVTRLEIGGTPSGNLFDRPYLVGFNPDSEPDPRTTPDRQRAYRWAFGAAALRWPGAGRAPHALALQVVAGSPMTVVSAWRLDDRPLLNVAILTAPRRYHLLLPATGGDVALGMTTPTWTPPHDPRALSFAVDWATLAGLGRGAPAWSALLGVALGLALLLGLTLLWAVPIGTRATALLGLALLAVAVLRWQRLALTTALPRWLALLVAAYPLTLGLRWLLARVARRWLPGAAPTAALMAGLVVVAWLVRAAALLHPQAITSDAGLHVNNLRGVVAGALIFTEDLPARAGGGPAPYPPGAYVALAPALLVAEPALLMTVGSALADSLTIIGLWLVCAGAALPAAAAPLAGLLYVFALPSLRSLAIGEMANVWGQALALPLLVALARPHERRTWLALVLIALVALLGHYGVFVAALVFAGGYGLWLVASRDPQRWPLVAALAVAALLAVGLYYAVWWRIIVHRPPAPAAATTGIQRVAGALGSLVAWDDVIGPLLLALGLAGWARLVLLRYRLAPVVSAWWAAGLLGVAPLLVSQQALRWQLWLFPTVALCGGVALAALWRRGRAAQALVCAVVALCWLRGAWWWVHWIATYLHEVS